MNYSVKKSNYIGSPELIKDEQGNPSHVNQSVSIDIGIDGATDDFNVNTQTIIRLELTDTIAAAIEKVQNGIAAFVAEKYPNT